MDPMGNSRGYEIMYFGVNLILMLDYRLSFDIDVKNDNSHKQSRSQDFKSKY